VEMEPEVRVRVVLELSDAVVREKGLEALRALLDSDRERVRKAAVLKLVKALSRVRLTEVLAAYLESEHRYYNVVFWLDLGASAPRGHAARAASVALADMLES
jgi:hypothetical protein